MIDSILFDMGGTLENVTKNRQMRMNGIPLLRKCLRQSGIEIKKTDEEFLTELEKGNAAYKAWSEVSMIESPSLEIWHKWNLGAFGIPENRLADISEELAELWETQFFRRTLRPDVPGMLESLSRAGYRLGIISNTSSRGQVFHSLEAYGIDHYFGSVCLSSIEGIRKPRPEIFLKAVNALGSIPVRAAYVGDTLARDVTGAKKAGYAAAVHMKPEVPKAIDAHADNLYRPDYVITMISEIMDIFTP